MGFMGDKYLAEMAARTPSDIRYVPQMMLNDAVSEYKKFPLKQM